MLLGANFSKTFVARCMCADKKRKCKITPQSGRYGKPTLCLYIKNINSVYIVYRKYEDNFTS